MPWLKSDDGEWCQPWVIAVGPAAYGVYIRLAGYSAQNLTDGHVPAEIVLMVSSQAPDAIDALDAHNRVQRDKQGGIYLPHFLDSNPTASEYQTVREKRSAAGRAGGKAKRKPSTTTRRSTQANA